MARQRAVANIQEMIVTLAPDLAALEACAENQLGD